MLVAMVGYTLLCTPAGWRVHNLTHGTFYAPPDDPRQLCWLEDGSARLYDECPPETTHVLVCE